MEVFSDCGGILEEKGTLPVDVMGIVLCLRVYGLGQWNDIRRKRVITGRRDGLCVCLNPVGQIETPGGNSCSVPSSAKGIIQ